MSVISTSTQGFQLLDDEDGETQGYGHEILSEVLGTWVMMVLGLGVNAQTKLSVAAEEDCPGFETKGGSPLSIHLGWGIAVYLGIQVAGKVSGAHLNPAVTLAFAVHRRFPWCKVPLYILAQTLGAFLAAAAIYSVYWPALMNYGTMCCGGDPYLITETCNTAAIFNTFPASYEGGLSGFWDEIFGTTMLLLCIFAISDTDVRMQPQDRSTTNAGMSVALVVVSIGFGLGCNTGYAINPARDLGTRVFTAAAGWGAEPFEDNNYYFWIPLVGPCVGSVLGSSLYQAFSWCVTAKSGDDSSRSSVDGVSRYSGQYDYTPTPDGVTSKTINN